MPASLELPYWLRVLSALGPTLAASATLLVGIMVAIVSYRQWRTAHQKLVLDTFAHRLKVYQDLRLIVDDAVLLANPTDKELLLRIHRLSQEAAFLFGEDVTGPLRQLEMIVMQVELAAVLALGDKTGSSSGTGELRTKAVDLIGTIATAMRPYMRMDQRRIRSSTEWIHDRNKLQQRDAGKNQVS